MKKLSLFFVVSVLSLIFFASCEKSDSLTVDSVTGKYVGTLSADKSFKNSGTSSDAVADITDEGNGQITVHCYSDDLDTTFMLNYYENGDSIMVCLNGDAFEEMYGHMMGDGQHTSGMMGQDMMGNGSMDWANHMDAEHEEGDEHFGGFDMTNNTFDYTMQTDNGNYRFQGTKINK